MISFIIPPVLPFSFPFLLLPSFLHSLPSIISCFLPSLLFTISYFFLPSFPSIVSYSFLTPPLTFFLTSFLPSFPHFHSFLLPSCRPSPIFLIQIQCIWFPLLWKFQPFSKDTFFCIPPNLTAGSELFASNIPFSNLLTLNWLAAAPARPWEASTV